MSKYILSDIFEGDFPITQYFGQRPEYYKQFGFAGHEGVDWGTPTGTKILAPFDGKILQDNDPKNGAYGNYIVVWDYKQKCAVWGAHLDENFVSIGDMVKKGQVIGKTGSSGNTSGPHYHLNFCETDGNGMRMNQNNGFKGFLNVLDPNLVEWNLGNNQPIPQPSEIILPTVFTDQTKIPIGGEYGEPELQALRGMLIAKDKRIKELEVALESAPVSSPDAPIPAPKPFSNPIAKLLYSLAQAFEKTGSG